MKPTKKQPKRENQPNLEPGVIETYRTYPPVDIDDSIRGMAAFLVHRSGLLSSGAEPMAAAAERAWWADAVILAGQETETADQARRKLKALEPAVDGRIWLIADEGMRAISAMIAVACQLELRRWGFEAPTHH